MKIKLTRTVRRPVDEVWTLLGPDYIHAGTWASGVYASAARAGSPKVAEAPVAGRVCQTSLGPFTETIEAYDPAGHHLSYSATGEKMPGFMKSLRNSWTLEPLGPDQTRVHMQLEADIAFPFNILMGWMLRLQFGKVVREAIEEFVHYAETGQPHPRKVKVDGSKKARIARQALA